MPIADERQVGDVAMISELGILTDGWMLSLRRVQSGMGIHTLTRGTRRPSFSSFFLSSAGIVYALVFAELGPSFWIALSYLSRIFGFRTLFFASPLIFYSCLHSAVLMFSIQHSDCQACPDLQGGPGQSEALTLRLRTLC